MTPSEVLVTVLEGLEQIGLADQSLPRIANAVTRFTAYLERGHHIGSVHDIDARHVEGFIFAPFLGSSGARRPAIATMHLRRTALRLYFRIARQKGILDVDPTADLSLPPRSGLPCGR
jgi:lauroyl/myristoyl acyltransferase